MNTVESTVAAISPIIIDGILRPIAKAHVDGKLTGTTVDELTSQMRDLLLLVQTPKPTPRPVGAPKTVKSTVPAVATGGFVPKKKGNRYVLDPHATCQYIWKKGADKKGKCCGKEKLQLT